MRNMIILKKKFKEEIFSVYNKYMSEKNKLL